MKTSTRKIEEMLDMYGLPAELYTMNRGVKTDGKLRYDITIIPSLRINGQPNKTKGHIHKTGHPELYIVLEGCATFIFQKGEGKDVRDFYYIEAEKGEAVIVPGDYYHVTINAGQKTLKLANWISDDCVSDYALLEKMKGMCYYLIDRKWVKNENYQTVPKLRAERSLTKIPTDLKFLL